MKSNHKYLSGVVAATLAAGGLTSQASDWPRWGGPDPGRDMISTETGLPDHFTTKTNGQISLKPGSEDVDVNGVLDAPPDTFISGVTLTLTGTDVAGGTVHRIGGAAGDAEPGDRGELL